MSALVVGGVVVKVHRDGASLKPVENGENTRAIDGSPVSDVSAVFDELAIRTVALAPSERTALRAVLRGTMPLSCYGDLLGVGSGSPLSCDVLLGEEKAVKAKDGPRWELNFTLRVGVA